MSDATEAYHVSRTLGTLELLAHGPRSSGQVADALQIHVRTARRTLARLAHDGYASRSEGQRPLYSLTPRFTALASRALREQVRRQGSGSQPLPGQGSQSPSCSPARCPSMARDSG